jgi:hypothetical protein
MRYQEPTHVSFKIYVVSHIYTHIYIHVYTTYILHIYYIYTTYIINATNCCCRAFRKICCFLSLGHTVYALENALAQLNKHLCSTNYMQCVWLIGLSEWSGSTKGFAFLRSNEWILPSFSIQLLLHFALEVGGELHIWANFLHVLPLCSPFIGVIWLHIDTFSLHGLGLPNVVGNPRGTLSSHPPSVWKWRALSSRAMALNND